MSPRAIALLASLLVTSLSASSAAEEQAVEQFEEARAAFELGVQLLDRGQLDAAADALEHSLALRVSAPALYDLALVRRKQGRIRAAIDALERLIAFESQEGSGLEKRPDTDASPLDVRPMIAELRSQLAHVTLRIGDAGASILLDGEAVSSDVRELELDPGKHVVEAKRQGGAPERRTLDLAPGEHAELELARIEPLPLDRRRAEARPKQGAAAPEISPESSRRGPAPDASSRREPELEDGGVAGSWLFWTAVVVAAAAVTVVAVGLASSSEPAPELGSLKFAEEALTR